jgi:hypothetical protein
VDAERVDGEFLPAAEVEPGDGRGLGCLGLRLGVEPIPGAHDVLDGLLHPPLCRGLVLGGRAATLAWSAAPGALAGACMDERYRPGHDESYVAVST